MRSCEQKRSLQCVDGNHAQAKSGKGFCQAKCPHIKCSMVGACNHAVSFIPKLLVGVVSLMAIVWMLPRVQIYSKCGFPSGPGLKLLLELPKSNSLTEDLAQP